jgi:hypothetical protein
MGNHPAVKRAWRENSIQVANQENGELIRGAMTTDPDSLVVGTLGALEGERGGQRLAQLLSYLCHALSIMGVAVYGYDLVQKSQEITLEGLDCFFYFR